MRSVIQKSLLTPLLLCCCLLRPGHAEPPQAPVHVAAASAAAERSRMRAQVVDELSFIHEYCGPLYGQTPYAAQKALGTPLGKQIGVKVMVEAFQETPLGNEDRLDDMFRTVVRIPIIVPPERKELRRTFLDLLERDYFSDARYRRAAGQVIAAHLATPPHDVEELRRFINTTNVEIRTGLVLALPKSGFDRAEAVRVILRVHDDPASTIQLKMLTIRALGELGDAARPAIPSLVQDFKEYEREGGWMIADALLRIEPDNEHAVRWWRKKFQSLDDLAFTPKEKYAPRFRPELVALLDAKKSSVRLDAIKLLWHVDPQNPRLLPVLVDCLKDPAARDSAALAIPHLFSAEARPADPRLASMAEVARPLLLASLDDVEFNSHSQAIYIQALAAMGKGDERTLKTLEKLAHSKQYSTRAKAVEALAAVDMGQKAKAVIAAFLSDRECTPWIGVQKLAEIARIYDCVGELVNTYVRELDDNCRLFKVCEGLVLLADERATERAVPRLLTLTSAKDAPTRQWAAWTLGELSPGELGVAAVENVLAKLAAKDPSYLVQWQAHHALQRLHELRKARAKAAFRL